MSSRVTSGAQKRFLQTFAEVGTIREACRQANVGRRTHYDWMEDPAYRAAFEDAKEDAVDGLVEECRRRARDGVEEPVFYLGQQVGAIRKYSDSMLMFLIRGWRPDTYREQWKGELQHTGALAVSRGPDLKQLTHEQLEQLEQLALSAAADAAAHAGSGSDPEGEAETGADED
jgi:hypothetical protein